jgi:hypothetical protein
LPFLLYQLVPRFSWDAIGPLSQVNKPPLGRTSWKTQKTNFVEFLTCEVPRIPIPRTWVNKGKREA